jgi:hypothetical protein
MEESERDEPNEVRDERRFGHPYGTQCGGERLLLRRRQRRARLVEHGATRSAGAA